MPCVSSQYPLSEDSESTTTVVVTPPHEPHSQRRKVGGKDTPLTLEQLIAIGRDRGLTLYP